MTTYKRIPKTFYVKNEKGEEAVYYVDKKHSIIFRSLLESDLNRIATIHEEIVNPKKEGRNKKILQRYKRMLTEYRKKCEPEIVFFVMEDINQKDTYGKNLILGYANTYLGSTMRECDMTCKIELFVYDKRVFQAFAGNLIQRISNALDNFFNKVDESFGVAVMINLVGDNISNVTTPVQVK